MFTRQNFKKFKHDMKAQGITENQARDILKNDILFSKQFKPVSAKIKVEEFFYDQPAPKPNPKKQSSNKPQKKQISTQGSSSNSSHHKKSRANNPQICRLRQKQLRQKQDQTYKNLILKSRKNYEFLDGFLTSQNTFMGTKGHFTVKTLWPIFFGTYYLEVSVVQSKYLANSICQSSDSSFRIGITSREQHLLAPLGGKNSYCFNSRDGSCIYERNVISKLENRPRIEANDTFGLLLHIQPPYRKELADVFKINHGSYLAFLLNGKQISRISNLEQCFYIFGVSTFNEAAVKINLGPDFKYSPFEKFTPYIFQENQKCPFI